MLRLACTFVFRKPWRQVFSHWGPYWRWFRQGCLPLMSMLWAIIWIAVLTLYHIKTPFDAFANRADPDQAALLRAAWSGSTHRSSYWRWFRQGCLVFNGYVVSNHLNCCINPLPHRDTFWYFCKQSRPRSGSSYKSCLIRVFSVCLWKYD